MMGDVEVIRVRELQGPFGPTREIVPDCLGEVWSDNKEWMAPEFWEPDSDSFVATVQTWVLRSEGKTVLVDTGVGNGRQRPGAPPFDNLKTDFLSRLDRAGVRPEEVDVVVNTHIHADHVGWNTVEQDGEWVPAFPNAGYLLPAADNAHFGPDGPGSRPERREIERLVFADSIEPVHRSGQAVLWEGTHRIDANLTLESAHGHTPGSAVLRLASGSDRAVFVGDLLHSPVQILEPSCNSCFDEDAERAAASRRSVLERAADEGELVVPAHFGGAGAVEVRRDGSKFAITRWAAYA
ncbi:MBL fold metallo-hydrolase [Streptomyces sp. NPDC060064]|uniref:MBL fold metallo-hydrolase n=1 Tax=Streptomyces sp. NPDC060064 TaxID=3347049 RepID=UPI0036CC57FA